MVSLPPAKCCATLGHIWNGEPTGKVTTFAQVQTYISAPQEKQANPKVVLILTDVFGIATPNPKLIADEIAKQGYTVLIPDLFAGNPYPVDAKWDEEGTKKFHEWHATMTSPVINERLLPVLEEVRKVYQPTSIGAAGYCFGAKYVVQLLAGQIDAGFIAHPTNVLKEEMEQVKGPLFIAAAEVDNIFPLEKRNESELVLKEKKATYSIALFGGVSHGFATRGDPNNNKEKYAKEKALWDMLYWFQAYL
ncbi:dienelactone hydrolase family protein [Ascobolus immersus RN42]|uniref:Dienelactone hydrolase family protein n=1 Tax=Ascobolus immersus RN42 TaxID=1160509 RepID=A0A3N4I187_ASCIM|nr:dienelactone hydrolase family protein [Ascobolus immersus RN42]